MDEERFEKIVKDIGDTARALEEGKICPQCHKPMPECYSCTDGDTGIKYCSRSCCQKARKIMRDL